MQNGPCGTQFFESLFTAYNLQKLRRCLIRQPATDQGLKLTRKRALVHVRGFASDNMMTWGFQVGALSGCGQEVYGPYLVHLGASTSLLPGSSTVFQERCLAAVLRKLGVGERCSIVGLGHGGSFAFEMGHDTPGPRLLRGRLWR